MVVSECNYSDKMKLVDTFYTSFGVKRFTLACICQISISDDKGAIKVRLAIGN